LIILRFQSAIKLLFILILLSLIQFSSAQNITVFSQLHDSLQPKIIRLSDVPKPIAKKAGEPTITTFSPNMSKGKSFFTTYTSDDGLAMDEIAYGHKSSICDSKGNLWFATTGGGVSKYDGNSFSTFTTKQGLAYNAVWCILEDRNGNLWFGTSDGVSKYDGRIFTTFTTEDGLTNNNVLSIAEDKSGNLWFGTHNGGVSKFDGKSFVKFDVQDDLESNSVRSLIEDKKGNIWFGTNSQGVKMYDGTSLKSFTIEDGLSSNTIRSIVEDEKGNIWFGTYGGGVSVFDGISFKTYGKKDGLANNIILSSSIDKKGNIWLGTYGGGVCKYDGNSFKSYSTEHGLVNNTVRSITEDKSGNLWFGTQAGISKYHGSSFVRFTDEQGVANNSVISLSEDKKGNIWFGTAGKGISKYDGSSIKTFTSKEGLAGQVILSIITDKNSNVWFGTYGRGVSKYDGNFFYTYTTLQGLANNSIISMSEEKSGNIWFGTSGGGVSMYDGNSFTTYTTEQGLADNTVRCIFIDRVGNVWLGTSDGVSKFDGKSFSTYTVEDGLANNTVLSISEDKSGNIWFGTNGGGLNLLREQNKIGLNEGDKKSSFLNISDNNGLPDNVIVALKFDDKGRLMIGSNFGIYVLSKAELERVTSANSLSNIGTLKGVIYNQFTGYPVRNINSGAILIDQKGKLWMGNGSKGAVLVDVDAVNKNKDKPNVIINRVNLNGEAVCYYNLLSCDSTVLAQQEIITYGKTLYQEERDVLIQRFKGVKFEGITAYNALPIELSLPYKHNALTFEFNTIETGRNFMVNYQYMLKGMDDDWGLLTNKKTATYNNLNEGEYTFLLKAQSPWGVWSDSVEFHFVVLPPLYRTWWAYSLYVLFGLVLIWQLIQIQTKRLKQRQIELEEEVEFATKEIRQQKEQVEEAHKEIKDSINYAERIQRSFLATSEILDENLNDYFVFFQPRDVVSGDFYWASKLSNNSFAFVNADSTGHGVPGAIMSILNISSIEKAIETETEPHNVLNSTRKLIIERLKKDGSKDGGKDGMDCSFLILNEDKSTLTFASAFNPVWIIREGELLEYKGDRMSVGKGFKDKVSFTLRTVDLMDNDMIYTLTDGFSDQFGGEKGKKFMTKKLKALIVSISHLPMAEQKNKLKEVFTDWKGNEGQVDDVCIAGFRV
jgi:ligand-binding sensor domain-containing protein/serine phosphatase RsbU (regulator of sigma subunit)